MPLSMVLEVAEYYKDNILIKKFQNVRETSKYFGLTQNVIRIICRTKNSYNLDLRLGNKETIMIKKT